MLCTIDVCGFDVLAEIIRESVRTSVASCEEDAQFLIDDIERSLREWLDSGSSGYGQGFQEAGRVVGFIVVKDHWNLSHLFVSPASQRRGIGSALIRAAIDHCAALSPRKKIQLNSSSNAAPFYEAVGFVQTGPGIERPGGCIPYEFAL